MQIKFVAVATGQNTNNYSTQIYQRSDKLNKVFARGLSKTFIYYTRLCHEFNRFKTNRIYIKTFQCKQTQVCVSLYKRIRKIKNRRRVKKI